MTVSLANKSYICFKYTYLCYHFIYNNNKTWLYWFPKYDHSLVSE